MATIEYWIQLENRLWDVSPHDTDRITGQNIKDRETPHTDPIDVTLTSLETPSVSRSKKMFKPLRESATKLREALILRRYKPPQQPDQSDAWTIPDDRKINAWDLNEPDPTNGTASNPGTMGTIPGPVIECSVGDDVVVHYRNMDMRGDVVLDKICFHFPLIGEICLPFRKFVLRPIEKRLHSLHPHGFVFAPQYDGAFPLSPPDPGTDPKAVNSISAAEAAAWASIPGFSGSRKKGDRVPPGGTFIYHWNTFGWPTTAGVWLYHDHSVCDMESTELGAIGIIVIHNTADINNEVDIRLPVDQQDATGTALDPQFLPGGSPNGTPRHLVCFPFPRGINTHILPQDLDGLGDIGEVIPGHHLPLPHDETASMEQAHGGEETEPRIGPPVLARTIRRGDLIFELDKSFEKLIRLCHSEYRVPPAKALYLQLFHTLTDAGMCINGRKYLGNTPTLVAGPHTRMRFGVVGMGSDFHTFHIHGHRWVLPGPHGNNPDAIKGSVQDTPVSQFEDTRTFGPANSFVFTIEEGSGFMRADPFTPGSPVGEWHMHCHVLMHMDQGMMGSLLVINENGGLALPLPKGMPCEMEMDGGGTQNGPKLTATVKSTSSCTWRDDDSGTPETTIKAGGTVSWVDAGCPGGHTVDFENVPPFHAPPPNGPVPGSIVFAAAGDYGYHCGIHGGSAASKTGMYGIVHVQP